MPDQSVTPESLDEACEIIKGKVEEGFYGYPKLVRTNLYLHTTANETFAIDLSKLKKKEREKVLTFAKEEAKAKRDELKRERADDKKKVAVGTGRYITLEQLDRSHAKIVRNLTEATGWFADVLHEIGFYATIIAMQHAKVPPDQLYEQVVRFRDPSEFAEYVKNHLAALLEATEDAKALLELRELVDKLEVKLYYVTEALRKMKHERDELLLMFHTALGCMCPDDLRQFMLAFTTVRYGRLMSLAGGNGYEFGEGFDKGSGEEEGYE